MNFASMTPRLLYIVGAGGFGREVAWLASDIWGNNIVIRFVVDHPDYLTGAVNGIPVELLSSLRSGKDSSYVVAIGEPSLRSKLASKMRDAGFQAQTLIHPGTHMSERVELEEGVLIAAGNILTTDIKLARHVHVNLACTIGHDVTIGEFSTLSPGVHVSGHVRIGKGVFIGTGANIINGSASQPLVIGDGAIVAAGACVTRDVEPGSMVAGVPATRRR